MNGTTLPTGGNNGDFYLDTTTDTLYGPKASGTWPATGTSLAGTNGVTYDCSATAYPGIDLADCTLTSTLTGANLTGANLTGVTWSSTTCPDGTNSNNDSGTCSGHLG